MTDDVRVDVERDLPPRSGLMWHMPTELPELSIPGLTRWIEAVRNAAFIAGARHDSISTAEATALLPHLLALQNSGKVAAEKMTDALSALIADVESGWGDPHTLRHAKEALRQSSPDTADSLPDEGVSAEEIASEWQPPETAPKDGTILELVVDYSAADAHGPLQDAIRACTIGWKSFDDTGDDEWKIVGWDWCHDCICEGSGTILAWRPSRLMACDDALPPLTLLTAHRAQKVAS